MDDDTLRWFLRDEAAFAWGRSFHDYVQAASFDIPIKEKIARMHDAVGKHELANQIRTNTLGDTCLTLPPDRD